MANNTVRGVIEVDFKETMREARQYTKVLGDLRKEIRGLHPDHDSLNKALKEAKGAYVALISSSTKLSNAQQKQADKLRAVIRRLAFFTSEAKESEEALDKQTAALKKAQEAADKVAETTKKKAEAEAKAVETVKNAGKEYERLAGIFAKLFPTLEQTRTAIEKIKGELIVLRASEAAATDEGKRAIALRQQALQILGLQASQLAELKRQTDAQTKAQERQDKSIGGLLKKIGLWLVASASMYYAYRRLRRAVVEAIKDVFEETAGYEALAEATKEFQRTLILSTFTQDEVSKL
ncbi:MAG: hypothetical protein ACXAEN_21175, partial [Candidatus Thorarchaeota archaeon]